ncbi:single-stranded DNA-binding protein [Actinomycetospora cinnamomea]|uniref:Single-strand DNA-binding protein n=1 Tax=Actinomycetospora cinnamomea TaxID=663609 RepID=A0A2U1EY96_9PSEU|nr:single-stranded DNA-binding protein [Actinomycetospora cinnamomea]PVZ04898.1 single-strand DNA-binding protein [Actinomycetospora cinnamomea]
MNETIVTVTGNVAGDVIARRVGGNEEHLLVTFRVASSERRWDKAAESWIDGDRFTASVNCWRRLAEGARDSLVKGDPVVVTGRLSVREYEVEGVRRYMTEIAATAVGPDLSRCTAQVRRRRGAGAEAGETAATADTAGNGTADVAHLPVESGPVRPQADGELARAARPLVPTGPDADAPLEEPTGAATTRTDAGEPRRGEPVRASA